MLFMESQTLQMCFIFVLHTAALSIVKEVANHANDIMKQGVRPDSISRFNFYSCSFTFVSLLHSLVVFQDNFQKLMQIQYSLNGHHEIVQPGRVGHNNHLPVEAAFYSVVVNNSCSL